MVRIIWIPRILRAQDRGTTSVTLHKRIRSPTICWHDQSQCCTISSFMPVLIMTQSYLPTYKELDQALSKTTLKLHPAQVHGLISGILCGNPQNTAAWEELVTGNKESTKTHNLLQALYDATAKQLEEFLFNFQLLLPPDTESLPTRAEALTLWSQGFLTGLKLVQVQIIDREKGEMTEAIDDLIEIAKMNYEDVVPSEEDEAAYIELVEFVRMAVILIYQDMREAESSKKNGSSSNRLH